MGKQNRRHPTYSPGAGLHSNHGSTLEGIFQIFMGAIAIAAILYLVLGVGVDYMAGRIPVDVEKKLFNSQAFTSGNAGKNGVEDARLAKLQPILERLTSQPGVPKLPYTLFLIKDTSPNAVATPGGGIGVTTGLLDSLNNNVAFAFVLGHELGHFAHRDHLRDLGRSIAIRIAVSYIFGNSNVGRFSGLNTMHLMHRKYSLSQEDAADRFGLKLVYNAYGTTNGTTKLFEMLQKSETTPKWAYMFSTHPAASSRITSLKKYAGELEKQSDEK